MQASQQVAGVVYGQRLQQANGGYGFGKFQHVFGTGQARVPGGAGAYGVHQHQFQRPFQFGFGGQALVRLALFPSIFNSAQQSGRGGLT